MKKIILSILLLLVFVIPVYAQNSYRIYGTITYEGMPLPGDTVIATNLQSQQTNKTQTGHDGTYELNIEANKGNTIKVITYNATIFASAANSDIKIDISLPKKADTSQMTSITGMSVYDFGTGVSRKAVLAAGTILFVIVSAFVLMKLSILSNKRNKRR